MSEQDFWRGGIKLLTSAEDTAERGSNQAPPVNLTGGRMLAFPQERWQDYPVELPKCDLEDIAYSRISDPAVYKEAKSKLSVGCVDIWVVKERRVLLGRRASPYDVLNGWWWPIGARIQSDEEGVVPFEESALLTLQLETGISPETVESLFWLGTGINQFEKKLTYQDKNHVNLSEAELETPFSTINVNLVASLANNEKAALSKNISDYWWVEQGEIEEEPGNNLCEYVTDFLEDIFLGLGRVE